MRLLRLFATVVLALMILPEMSASSASAASSIRPCTTDQLSVLLSNVQGFAGTGVMAIDIGDSESYAEFVIMPRTSSETSR